MLYPDYKSRSRQKNNRRELVPRKLNNGRRKPSCRSEMNRHPVMDLKPKLNKINVSLDHTYKFIKIEMIDFNYNSSIFEELYFYLGNRAEKILY